MNIGAIVKDSLKYPLSNWKSYLILGIILVFADLYLDIGGVIPHYGLIRVLDVVGFVIGIFSYGYMFRIIKSSLFGANVLPEFNDWVKMFYDGLKVIIVFIAYLSPILLIVLGEYAFRQRITGLSVLIAILYVIAIIPIVFVAIGNMANNESKLISAIKFHEISNKISHIGWGNLIIGYIVTGIVFLAILGIINIIYYLFSFIDPFFAGIIFSLILAPYADIFVARSVALFYMPDNED